MSDNPDYLWRPDPKGERRPQTLFGLPITYNKPDEKTSEEAIIVLGDFSHYVVVKLTQKDLDEQESVTVLLSDVMRHFKENPEFAKAYAAKELTLEELLAMLNSFAPSGEEEEG